MRVGAGSDLVDSLGNHGRQKRLAEHPAASRAAAPATVTTCATNTLRDATAAWCSARW
ncbi:hypothetical protein [Streptomyces sp. NPDC002788]